MLFVKKILPVIMALALMTALAACGAVPAEKTDEPPEEGGPMEILPLHGPSYSISFTLPAGWTCHVTRTEDDPTTVVSAVLRPAAVENGDITVAYQKNFAVCRNCVDLKDVTLNGEAAVQAMFIGNDQWDFITLKDQRGCVIINSAASWYKDYAGDIEALLASVTFTPYP